MGEPFVSEIRAFAFDFAPKDWAKCDGAVMPISQYPTLYALLGPTFGGNGTTTFAIPDLRGRTPIHMGALSETWTYELGQKGGQEDVTLTNENLAPHTHDFVVCEQHADKIGVQGRRFAIPTPLTGEDPHIYTNPENLVPMDMGCVSWTGSNQPHTNIQPTQVINYCISLDGYFPPRN